MFRPYSPERFEELVAEFVGKEAEIMARKKVEYSPGEDRLQDFRDVAEFFGGKPIVITPAVVAMIQLLKHVVNLKNVVSGGQFEWAWTKENGGEGTKQRIADTRNLSLFVGAALDEMEGANKGVEQ